MAEFNLSTSTTTDYATQVQNYSVDSEQLDGYGYQKETWYDFPDAHIQLGSYKNVPHLKSAMDALSIYAVGLGFTAKPSTLAQIKNFVGWGEDSFESILFNMQVQKKIYGDAFAEVIRDDKDKIVNLKPLDTGAMRTVVDSKGMIVRYEQREKNQKGTATKKFKPNQIFHLVNERVGDEIHGMSVVDSAKPILEAWMEAIEDERLIKHRDKALGIAYYKTDKTSRISYVNQQIEKAVNKGEMLGLPEDGAEIKEFPSKSTTNRLDWIRYLENAFYQAVKVPRVIATSEGFTEAGSKVGFLTFEPVYTREQTDMEADLWNQLAIKIKFNKPPSLQKNEQEDEQKNAGQVGFQPSDTTASVTRNE